MIDYSVGETTPLTVGLSAVLNDEQFAADARSRYRQRQAL